MSAAPALIADASLSGMGRTKPRPERAPKPKRPRGRPPTLRMPEPIDATPEEIARKVLNTPPPREWKFLKDQRRDG